MAFQRVPDTAQVNLNYLLSGTIPARNTFYARNTVFPWTVANLNTLATGVANWWTANVKPLQHSGIHLSDVSCKSLDTEFGAQGGVVVNADGTRVETSGRTPYNTAALIQFKGDFGAAPSEGWIFHSGLVDADQSEIIVSPTVTALLDTAYTALAPAMTAAVGSTAQVIVSRFQGGVKRTIAVTNTLRSVEVPAAIHTIKSRLH